jgi:lipopolysaccharide biosynthesis regulator YciM
MADYNRLSNHPHYMTIYNRFGSWRKAVELAKKYEENSK